MKNLTFAIVIAASFAGSFAATSFLNASESPALSSDLPSTLAPIFSATAVSLDNNEFRVADADGFLRLGDDDFVANISADISTEVLGSHTIRKIGGGNESHVTVVRTPSGTYSTDGLESAHVQYYGIETKPTEAQSAMAWFSGLGWATLPMERASSIIYINTGDVSMFSSSGGTRACARGDSLQVCY